MAIRKKRAKGLQAQKFDPHLDDEDISGSDEDDYAEEETHGEKGSSDEDMDDSDSGHTEAQKDDAMKELEEEYRKHKDEEQNILRNLKSHKDEDIRKGQAVKNQRALWNKRLGEIPSDLKEEDSTMTRKPFNSVLHPSNPLGFLKLVIQFVKRETNLSFRRQHFAKGSEEKHPNN